MLTFLSDLFYSNFPQFFQDFIKKIINTQNKNLIIYFFKNIVVKFKMGNSNAKDQTQEIKKVSIKSPQNLWMARKSEKYSGDFIDASMMSWRGRCIR